MQRLLHLFIALWGVQIASAQVSPEQIVETEIVLEADVTPLISPPSSWQMTTAAFESTFVDAQGEPLFDWLTSDKTRARLARKKYANAVIDLTLFDKEIGIEEAIIDFANGRVDLVTVSIFNRGDAPNISPEKFDARFLAVGKHMSSHIGGRPRQREAKAESGILTEGYSWKSENGFALLEHNEGARSGKKEFLRLRISHPDSISSLAQAMQHDRGGAAVKVTDLPERVIRDDNGDTYISSVPMVDQGSKGYCVCATVERVFEYYGIGVDMHQIAEIANADPEEGTSSLEMSEQLDKIDYRFKTRLKILAFLYTSGQLHSVKRGQDKRAGRVFETDDFVNELKRSTDRGVPIIWAMTVGDAEEEPPLQEGAYGGHMRLLIGYNEKTERVIFTDSWGAGHEKKTMTIEDAYRVTHGLFTLTPTMR